MTQYGVYENTSIIKGGSVINNPEYVNFCTLFKGTSGNNNKYLSNPVILQQYPTLFNAINISNVDYKAIIYVPNILNYNVLITGYNITDKITESSEYKAYNKDIILGYEYTFFTYYEDGINFNNFIQQQNMYIAGLNEKQKNIIADYIRPAAYNLLKEFLIDYSPGYIQRYITNKKECFTNELANSFCDYIEYFIRNDSINYPIQNITHIIEKTFDDNAHDIYNSISEDIWTQIIFSYLNDLNTIILNAPKSSHTFIVYRGAEEDYIIPQEYNADGISIYRSNRIISVSINYMAAKNFYDNGINPNLSILYRIAIPSGSNLLFVTPFAPIYYKYEMEFILPVNQFFYAANN